MHVDQCEEVIQLEISLDDIKSNVNAKIGAHNTHCQILKDISFKFSYKKEVAKIDIYKVFMTCQLSEPKNFQEAEIDEMILELQEKVNQIILEE